MKRFGRVSLGAELVAGMRIAETVSDDRQWYFHQSATFVEPRVRANVWILRWLAAGVYGSETSAGFRLTVTR